MTKNFNQRFMHVAVFLGGLFALLQNANACSFPTAHQCNWAAYAIDKNPASAANLNSNNMANYGGTPYGQIVGVLPDSCFAKLPFAYAAQAEKCRKSTVDNLNTGVNIQQILKDNLTQKGYCGNVNIRTESWGDNQDPSSVVSYAGNSGNAFDGSMQLTACPVTVVPPSIRILINPSRTPFIANEIIMSGLTGQQYTVDVEISNAPTTAPITFNMPLPAGVTIKASTPIAAVSGNIVCTGTSLSTCSIPAGAPVGHIFINVYVDIANSATNAQTLVTAKGGGDAKCTGVAPACTASTAVIPILDAVDEVIFKTPLLPGTTDVSTNDKSPVNSEYSLGIGSTCVGAAISAAGVASYTSPAAVINSNAACTVVYKLCAPLPSRLVCKNATLTVSTQRAINSSASGVGMGNNEEKDVVSPVFQVTKTASNNPLFIGKPGQFYKISIAVQNGNVSAPISLLDKLPPGVSISGPVTAAGGTISNCPGAGATDLAGCNITVRANSYSIVVTVPVSVAASATSGANSATIKGGGSALCTGIAPACSGSTGAVAIVEPVDAVDDAVMQPAGGNFTFNVAANDKFPVGSTFFGGNASSCLGASVSPAGIASYTLPAFNSAVPTCVVQYQVCAPASSQAGCDSAYLRVTMFAVQAVGDAVVTAANAAGNADVAINDKYPAGSQFTLDGASSTCLNALMNSTGMASYTSPATGANCTVKYKLCAPAPNQNACSTAALTVSTFAAGGCASLSLTYQATVPAGSSVIGFNSTGNGCSFFASSSLLPAGSYKLAGTVTPFGTTTPQAMSMVTFALTTTGLLKGKAEYDTATSKWKLVQVP